MALEVLEKSYNPRHSEEKWYPFWESQGFFQADTNSEKPPFCMVIPPPNVTGSLHMGHALDHTIQDIAARWRRMCGYNVLWLPGTDHAGIATQYVIEKALEKDGLNRIDLGREEFLARTWQWKADSGGVITKQMRRLGDSCDWSRERFTMDEGLSRAVKEAFVRLYEAGLIYRGEYIVNWCPRCRTAIADLEVNFEPFMGRLYHINYPIKDSTEFIVVATTRPETMLGDTAVAVNPHDDRYKHLHGKTAILPLLKRGLPIVADDFVDSSFGTGAVKVTPAHDPADFLVAQRHDLPRIVVMNEAGIMTDAAGEFAGLDRFKCREKLVETLYRKGGLSKVEDYSYNLGHCQRCHTIVEPRLSMQWFVKVKPLADEAIRVVENGEVSFAPESYKKIYFEWMHNIRDWCISRQLWWGHRLPVWYCKACDQVTVAIETPAACAHCSSRKIEQESDVLDTWFSSSLWPFSTLGWPASTDDLQKFYPTSLLITGPDIIFFWVARMIMMGMYMMKAVPFHKVHIHGIVRDAQGFKMSKTRGNGIDPMELIQEYGADAVRFTLAAMAAPGSDIPFSSKRMKGYAAFANKIWNAARFILMNLPPNHPPVPAGEIDQLLESDEVMPHDRWILSRLNTVAGNLDEALESLRILEAASLLYHFFWHEFCDWYIELAKPMLTGRQTASDRARAVSTKVMVHVFDYSLRLLHPFMPYISEELWQKFPHEGPSITVAEFPKPAPVRSDPVIEEQMDFLMNLIVKIRNVRSEMNLKPGQAVPVDLIVPNGWRTRFINENRAHLMSLAHISRLQLVDRLSDDKVSLKGMTTGAEFALILDSIIDMPAERDRVSKEVTKISGDLEKISMKLGNQDFLTRAPQEVIAENQERQAELLARLDKLKEYLDKLNTTI